MPKKLDRNRYYATSYGDTNQRYLQDGIWFDNSGVAISSSPSAEGGVDKLITEAQPPAPRAVPAAAAQEPDVSDVVVDGSTPADDEDFESERNAVDPRPPNGEERGKLEKMTLGQLRSVLTKASGPPELLVAKGKNARQPIIDWLLANA